MAKGKHEAQKKTNKTESAKSTAAKKSGGAKKAVLITVIVIAVLAAAAFGGGCLAGRSDKIHPNLTLGSVAIGDMSVKDAAAKLSPSTGASIQALSRSRSRATIHSPSPPPKRERT